MIGVWEKRGKSDLEQVIGITWECEKGNWFGGGDKFELGYGEFEVSKGDKQIL